MTKHSLHVLACVLLASPPIALRAQETAVASSNRSEWVPAATSAVAPLQRRVALDLRRAVIRDALDALARAANLRVLYGNEVVASKTTVSLHVDGMTVGEALREMLLGTQLTAYVSIDGAQVLVRTPFAEPEAFVTRQMQGGGAIAGHVTDAVLRTPLSEVSVRLDGTTLGTTANADGKYTIAGVAPGTYRVTARRVGYQPLTKDITLSADQNATLDFALVAAPTRLDEVVTTAVGQQRRYEVGNDISTINADSVTPTAPITSLTDLISARAPGVEVLENSGLTGSGESIRIEGLTSLVLQNDPILIVDGIREDNSAGGDISALIPNEGTHPTPTRLNDIDFSDVQSIDILKGPSASTEYGTDAANGVIVITTKHGSAGAPQWKVSAEQTESSIPESFANNYYSWGHATDGKSTPVDCALVGGAINAASDGGSTSGACVVDSVTRWNPLNHAATSIFGTGDRGKYDLSIGGGSDAVRYFVSGSLTNEIGIARMPPVFKDLADTAALGLPSSAFSPNSEQQRSVRVNTSIKLGATADLAATASYLSTYQQTPAVGHLYFGAVSGTALNTPANFYGYGGQGADQTPISALSEIGSQNTDRVTGGLTANWRPAGWLVAHGTAGIDHGTQQNTELDYPLANSSYELYSPFLGIGDATTDVYSVDLRGAATASLTRDLRSVTSVGMQMADTRTVGLTTYASGITSTNLTLNGTTNPTVTQQANRQATLGGYGEEQLSLADRLFLTGALRIDAGSGFGRAYATAAYPKASVSWLAWNSGETTVRLRGAFGESGVQPLNGAALLLYTPTAFNFAGATQSVNQIDWPGNPQLQPERTAEFEGGADVTAWRNRVSIGLTGYSKVTNNALVNQTLGVDVGGYTYEQNIGEVQNTGVEGTATVGIIQNQTIAWDVAINASMNHNKLISLAPGVVQQLAGSVSGIYQAPGYPLYGIWLDGNKYADANHDGIIESDEIAIGDSVSYIGSSLPTQEASVSTHLGLWHGRLTVGGLVDYRGGYRILNAEDYNTDIYVKSTQGANDPTAPLWLQARAVGIGSPFYSENSLLAEDGSFVRVREVSITYSLPREWTRSLRCQSVGLTAAVRNLALWTRYTGGDPEVNNALGGVIAEPTTGGDAVNNDLRANFGAVPLLRYWVVRLNLAL